MPHWLKILVHLSKIVWREVGVIARIFYGIGIFLPGLMTKPIGITIQQGWLGMDNVITIPGWPAFAISISFAGIWTIYALSKLTLKQEDDLTPKFEISLPNAGEAVVTPEKYQINGEYKETESSYIRLCVQSKSKRQIQNCIANIVSMKKCLDGTNYIDSNIQDSIQLFWSISGNATNMSVPYRVKRHIDIVRASKETNKLMLTAVWPLRLRGFFDDEATYRLDIVINGDGITESIVIDIFWDGAWNTLKAEEFKNG